MDGLRAAASGLATQQARMDAIANDIANVSTPGYKKERLAFRDLVDRSGAAASDAGRSFLTGPQIASDNPLALAIDGPGFFQVKLADGRVALTRAGDFRADAGGDVVTSGGERLVPPITLPKGTELGDVTIAADGTVTAGGKKLGQIALVDVPVRSELQSIGGGLYLATTASGAADAIKDPQVRQGVLEGSNVDLGDAMVDLIDAQRSFQLASKALKTQDDLAEIANGIRR
jgi:flagellar basal-body rod protein FlgG